MLSGADVSAENIECQLRDKIDGRLVIRISPLRPQSSDITLSAPFNSARWRWIIPPD